MVENVWATVGIASPALFVQTLFPLPVSTSGFVADILGAIRRSGMVEHVTVAVEISFVVATQAEISCNRLISKYFRFSSVHTGLLVGARYRLKAPSCSQFIYRKIRQSMSTNSKWFRNGSEEWSGGDLPTPPLLGMEG